MFEPWIKTIDSAHGTWIGALAGSTDIAGLMAQQGAREGHEYAGPYGGILMASVGWAYGSVVGLAAGAFMGAQHGAKHVLTRQDAPPPSPPKPPKAPHS